MYGGCVTLGRRPRVACLCVLSIAACERARDYDKAALLNSVTSLSAVNTSRRGSVVCRRFSLW